MMYSPETQLTENQKWRGEERGKVREERTKGEREERESERGEERGRVRGEEVREREKEREIYIKKTPPQRVPSGFGKACLPCAGQMLRLVLGKAKWPSLP